MFTLWSFAKNVCQSPTRLQLVVHLTNPQTTVEELSNDISSSPNPGLVIQKEISDCLLGFGHSGAVPGRCPGSLCGTVGAFIPGVWRAFLSAPLSLWRGMCKASAIRSSASSMTGRAMPVRDFSGIASQMVSFALVSAGLVLR